MTIIYNTQTVDKLISQVDKMTIVFTNGCFDILHPGHLDYLSQAKRFGDILVVGINSDTSVRQLKGTHRPINDQGFRSQMVAGLKPVDYVVIFDDLTPIELIKVIKPSIHVKGGDYVAGQLPEFDVVKANGGDVKIIPFSDGYSSTAIINKIKSLI